MRLTSATGKIGYCRKTLIIWGARSDNRLHRMVLQWQIADRRMVAFKYLVELV